MKSKSAKEANLKVEKSSKFTQIAPKIKEEIIATHGRVFVVVSFLMYLKRVV